MSGAGLDEVELESSKKRTIDQVDDVDSDEDDGNKKMKKSPKAKVALAIGYQGTNYNGSQTQANANHDSVTVEDVLFQAIVRANGISQSNSDNMKKVSWHRTSRTDKGVHACINVISLKMMADPGIVDRINSELPEDIRVYGYKRVMTSFNPKNMCDSRQYEYVLPTFTLRPITEQERSVPDEQEITSVTQDQLSYRIDAATLERVRTLLNHYVGTRTYMNFTQKSKINGMNSTSRFIKEFTCSDPIVMDGMELVVMKVWGQSFMYNQIRKMIGFILYVLRGHAQESDFQLVFDAKKSYDVPLAPGAGLMLEMLHFEGYNNTHRNIHGPLKFEEYQPAMDELKAKIRLSIVKQEEKECIMSKWIHKLKSIEVRCRDTTQEEIDEIQKRKKTRAKYERDEY
ncbi:tRNA pseudouridine synthase A, mitochondrial [Acrasis kona]|uniref:tRNA pseudouridine synthase A, mitochondrial n=1 Tax=Acrasis kona TaxID=1008807 RepID=A0AAW2YTQ4_9EUKA